MKQAEGKRYFKSIMELKDLMENWIPHKVEVSQGKIDNDYFNAYRIDNVFKNNLGKFILRETYWSDKIISDRLSSCIELIYNGINNKESYIRLYTSSEGFDDLEKRGLFFDFKPSEIPVFFKLMENMNYY